MLIALVHSNKKRALDGIFHAVRNGNGKTYCGVNAKDWLKMGMKPLKTVLADLHFCQICARAVRRL